MRNMQWKTIVAMPLSTITLTGAMLFGALAHADDAVIATDKGLIKGTVAASSRSFLGIPFAQPPVGSLRWKAPQTATAWTGTRDATAAGSICPQTVTNSDGTTSVAGAENCLYLNVYTPYPLSPTKLPVMVWIHGGGFTGGSGSGYDARVLAKKANAVVVTLNYRLGALGFLAHPALTSESRDASGNYGLLDQQAAIKWVKTNIANFGGDITKTMIFGESAGSASVCANVLSPAVAGYFQRAVMESGACTGFGFTPLATAQSNGTTFASNVGCTDPSSAAASCLRAVSVSALLSASSGVSTGLAFNPTVGGAVLPKMPTTALQTQSYNKVPILQGTNHDEGRLFTVQYEYGTPLTTTQYEDMVNQQFGSNGSSVLARYPVANYSSPTIAYATLFTDYGFSCPARTTDKLLAPTVATYAYEFNDPNAPAAPWLPGTHLAAYHGSEIQYIFQAQDTSAFTSAQLALSNQMIKYWATFASTGNPNASGQPAWPSYTAAGDQFLSLVPNATKPITSFAADHQCAFWSTLGI